MSSLCKRGWQDKKWSSTIYLPHWPPISPCTSRRETAYARKFMMQQTKKKDAGSPSRVLCTCSFSYFCLSSPLARSVHVGVFMPYAISLCSFRHPSFCSTIKWPAYLMTKNMVGGEEKKESVGEREGFTGRRCGDVVWHARRKTKQQNTALVFRLSILHAVQHYFFFVFAFIFVSGSSATGSSRDGRNGTSRPTNTQHKGIKTRSGRERRRSDKSKAKRKNCCQRRCWRNHFCWMQGNSLGDKNGLSITRRHYSLWSWVWIKRTVRKKGC